MDGPLPIYVGDELQLRKPHPCGANHWRVLRTGADLRLECAGCGHRLLLPRRQVERQFKAFLARGPRGTREQAAGDGGAAPSEPT